MNINYQIWSIGRWAILFFLFKYVLKMKQIKKNDQREICNNFIFHILNIERHSHIKQMST